jgi:hypothetical protein
MNSRKLFKSFWITLLFLCSNSIFSQEIIRYNEPEPDTTEIETDTNSFPPKFRGGENDFFAYLETYLGQREWINKISMGGERISFEFIVEEDGQTSNIKVHNSSNLELNIPIKNAIMGMEKWEPRKKRGKKVATRVYYSLMIRTVDTYPYVEITKDDYNIKPDPSTKALKAFMAIGATLILITLLIVQ